MWINGELILAPETTLLFLPPLVFFTLIGLYCILKPDLVSKRLIVMDWQSRQKDISDMSKKDIQSRINPKFVRLLGIIFFIIGLFFGFKILI
jgi:hypothetical protein